MSEKRLDVKVAASAAGINETARDVDRLAEAVRRANVAGGARGVGGGTFGGFLGGLKKQAGAAGLAGDNSLLSLIRGGGALAGVSMLGQSLQQLPQAVTEFRLGVKTGQTQAQAFALALANAIPIVGDLAKGMRSLRDVVEDWWQGRNREQDDEDKDTEANRQRNVARRDSNRETILFDMAEARRQERNARLGPVGVFNETKVRLDKEDLNRNALSPDQKKTFDEGMKVRRRNAEEARDKALAEQRASLDLKLFAIKEQLLTESGKQLPFEKEITQIRRETLAQDEELKRLQMDKGQNATQRRAIGNIRELLPAIEAARIRNLRLAETPNRTQLNDSRFMTNVGPKQNDKVEKDTAAMRKALEFIARYFAQLRPTTGPSGLISSPF